MKNIRHELTVDSSGDYRYINIFAPHYFSEELVLELVSFWWNRHLLSLKYFGNQSEITSRTNSALDSIHDCPISEILSHHYIHNTIFEGFSNVVLIDDLKTIISREEYDYMVGITDSDRVLTYDQRRLTYDEWMIRKIVE